MDIKDLPNGSIILCKSNEELKKKNIGVKTICYFTNSEYFHAKISCNGKLYEQTLTLENGLGMQYAKDIGGEIWVPKTALTKEESQRMYEWLEGELGVKYNLLMAIFLPIIWATRWLWKLINWVPFQHKVFGHTCSDVVDKAYSKIGIDILPNEIEGYITPGALADGISKDFVKIN